MTAVEISDEPPTYCMLVFNARLDETDARLVTRFAGVLRSVGGRLELTRIITGVALERRGKTLDGWSRKLTVTAAASRSPTQKAASPSSARSAASLGATSRSWSRVRPA